MTKETELIDVLLVTRDGVAHQGEAPAGAEVIKHVPEKGEPIYFALVGVRSGQQCYHECEVDEDA